MFNRIHRQLTIRNAAILSVILIGLNLFVYFTMKEMLFEQIDRSINQIDYRREFTIVSSKNIMLDIGETDRPIIKLLWSEDGRVLPMPGSSMFSEAQLKQLEPAGFSVEPRTVKVDGQYFRVKNNMYPILNNLLVGIDGNIYNVTKIQLLINVSAEIGMLKRLKFIMLMGGALGIIVAIAAGYYLANRALIPIRKSMERQQQFVSDASHELRTPLSVIQANTELLLRHPEHTIEQDSGTISTVLQETRRMSKLVGSLLMLARSDSNQLELERRPVLLDLIVRESVGKMQMLADHKHIVLQTDVDTPISMYADEERLHQLLIIVLDNAIKYTPEGGVVRVTCRKLAHSAQLEIEDTGIGIEPDGLPHVFDRFYRGDKSRSRHDGGTGLGLAIAKWIVERHVGKIRIESKLMIGTQVYITLPMQR
ncbi:sensor histidine kinase [Cohnella panacarvi]|uniref:sensor histidine kinase n=1 Tax=Cohnella panacarvi TaxID=400776 RepID=UPI00047BB169|nr:ATP-binding protein [Cohnella panacarvi]